MMNAPVILRGLDGVRYDTDKSLIDIDRQDCEDSLYTFLAGAWKCIDPSGFTEGWPIEAIAEHLQAVVDGDLKRLIINIPPRMGKSSITSVAFPAWTWAQSINSATSGPGVQFLHASYAQSLSLRDSVKCRRLITSPWYRERWGDRYALTGDQNAKTRFDNNKGGSRLSTSVGSALTGEGGSIIVVDDPNAAQEAFSEATIMVKVGGRIEHTAAEGKGPVNAIDHALRKALDKFYPELKDVKLHDYKVRVLTAGKGTSAKVRVLVESGDEEERWGTVGVSENIIEASYQALVDSIEYKLLKTQK